ARSRCPSPASALKSRSAIWLAWRSAKANGGPLRGSRNREGNMKLCNTVISAGRRLAFIASVTVTALSGAGHWCPAQAQLAVQCENCSTIWNQLLEYGKQVQQLATQLQSYETQLQQYANMVTNTLALPQQLRGQVESDIMQVRNLSNAASLLSGNAGSIVTRLQSATAYTNQVANL